MKMNEQATELLEALQASWFDWEKMEEDKNYYL